MGLTLALIRRCDVRHIGKFMVMLISFFIIASSVSAATPADTIETISASITSPQALPPARVAKRMENSVKTIGEQVLVGRNIVDVTNTRESYEKLVKEVFDRVLVGYTVSKVEIVPGSSAQINIQIVPWGDVIREVSLDIDFGGVSPEFRQMIARDIGNMEDKINGVLIGLPIDAVDWAGGISKSLIRELLAVQLPEFRATFDVSAGPKTIVKLSLLPIGPIVENTRVSLHSNTIPNVLLLEARPAVEEAVKPLRGLPVAFVERNRQYIMDKVVNVTAQHPVAKRYGLTVNPIIAPGVETQITVETETDKYKIWLEGYLDMGKAEESTSAKLHIGQNLSKTDELFLETLFIPSSVTWRFSPGWGHKMGSSTEAGLKYDTTQKQGAIWLRQNIASKWNLRLERVPGVNYNELGIRYKIHEFISAEYVFTNDEKWLRLIGNL